MGGRWMLAAVAIPTLVAMVALYLAVDNIARAGPGSAPAASPDVPTVISYQGLVTDPGTGDPVADGNYNMRFRIYDAAAAGALLWQEPAPADPAASVPVAGGVFTVLLGSVVPLGPAIFADGDAYLEVEVNGETLAPRQRIGAVAYAMVAETIDGQSLTNLDDRFVNETGDTMTGALNVLNGDVGIGTASPTSKLDVVSGTNSFRTGNSNSWLEVKAGGNTRLGLGDGDGNEAGFISGGENAGGENVLIIAGCSDPGSCPTFTTFHQSGNVGIGTMDPSATLDVRGDVVQSLGGDGLVKAAVHVDRDNGTITIDRWFNNVNGVAPTLSGSNGDYTLDMGFDVSQRFVACTIDINWVDTRNANCAAGTWWFSANPNLRRRIDINIWDPEGGFQAAEFNLIVY